MGFERYLKTGTAKGAAAFFLAAGISVSAIFGAFGAPPLDNIPEGVSEERWESLNDNVIEYDELGDLVQYFNPAYTQAMDTADSSTVTLSSAVDQFATYYRGLNLGDSIDSMRTAVSGLEAAMATPGLSEEERQKYTSQLMQLKAGIATAEATGDSLSKTVRELSQTVRNTEKRVEISLRPVKRQLEYGMQSAFIQYHQLLITRGILEKQVELYTAMLSASETGERQGLQTETERLAAENDLEQARLQLQQTDSALETIRRSMGLQLGWSADSLPEIGELPEPDITFPDTTNPEADKTAAFMHNSELKTAEKLSGGTAEREVAEKRANEYRGKLSVKMDSLYADMKNKLALYRAAATGNERAELLKASADRQYSLGLLGNAEYEAQQTAYISAKASYELAKLNLFSSINTYKWAVDGVVTLE